MAKFSELPESRILELELRHAERCVHPALDNYGMEIEKEWVDELTKLEKYLKYIREKLEREI